MEINENRTEDLVILGLKGRLDATSTQGLEERVLALLDDGVPRLVFDCAELDYINSSGLRIMVMALQRQKKNGGKVGVCCLKDYIQEIFEISGYDKLFPLFTNRDDAKGGW